jgi:hypothetical protein
MKQTSVEWLVNEITKNALIKPSLENGFNILFTQAKAMEKKQIIDAFGDSRILAITNNCSSGEQYYNETFKNK